MVGRRRQHHIHDETGQGPVVTGTESASDTGRRQDTRAEEVYGNLPVLQEHQYGEAVVSKQA